METRLSRIKPEKLEGCRGFSYDGYPYDRRYNLIALKKGTDPAESLKDSGLNKAKSLVLNGNVDVVPPGDPLSWREDPLSGIYRGGKIYGRGALDMKGGLAACHRSVFSRNLEYEAVTYGSDMRIINLYAGIPTVMYGPGDVACAHTANEYIAVDSVLEAIPSLALMLARWCKGSGLNLPD